MAGETKPSADGSGSLPTPGSAPQIVAGRYEVLGLLGAGGMGAVYKVRDREIDEVVALKMLRREVAESPGALDRFRREVKLARRVTHPNVARTFDLGEHGGDRFLTMELVEGQSLAAVLAGAHHLSLARVIDLVGPICAGLGAAHAAGVVHRDLKPDNVMVSADGRVVITDFGVARAQEAGAAQRTAVPVGTPAYMAPEQVEASADVDNRADIYALGVMLFELLTGRLPWEGGSVYAVAAMRLTLPPPDPRTFKPDLPEPVALLVMRCMARLPEDRPATAEEIAARFASMTLPASDVPSLAPPARASLRHEQPRTDPSQKTVAVLPFRNAGPPEDDYLVDGLTDDLIDTLSMTPGLRVRPRGVVMQLKGASSDPRELGRELSVQVVVEGTVRSSAERLRVNARVLSVEDGFQLWAKRFEGARADVLRIGDEAARAIADALAVRKPTRALLTDPEAIDLYLRGRHEYMKFWAAANDRAVELLESAHARAPEDPLIMSAYAAALARQFGITAIPGGRQTSARSVAEKAVEIAPQLAEAHVALATVRLHEARFVDTAREVRLALALSPLLADAHELRARLLVEVGQPREALTAARRAIQLEPRMAHLHYNVIWRSLALLGEWDEVEKEFAAVPEDADVASIYWLALIRKLQWTADAPGAAALLERIQGQTFPSRLLVDAAANMLITKKLPEAQLRFLLERASSSDLTPRMRAFWHQLSAEMLCYVGDHEQALTELAAASEAGLFDVTWMDQCPVLARLRTHPGFRELRVDVAARAESVARELAG